MHDNGNAEGASQDRMQHRTLELDETQGFGPLLVRPDNDHFVSHVWIVTRGGDVSPNLGACKTLRFPENQFQEMQTGGTVACFCHPARPPDRHGPLGAVTMDHFAWH